MRDVFRNRVEAGHLLGEELSRTLAPDPETIVLALPRGGVPIGYEVARALGAPLDVFIVRKLGVPGHEELAMGAIASGGVRVINEDVLRYVTVSSQTIDAVAAREEKELERREKSYRGGKPPLDVTGQRVIIVDDGLATGATMRAAVQALRKMNARQIIVAVPVAASDTCAEFRPTVDQLVCLRTPSHFQAVGLWYDDFSQTSDDEVHDLLARNPGAPSESR